MRRWPTRFRALRSSIASACTRTSVPLRSISTRWTPIFPRLSMHPFLTAARWSHPSTGQSLAARPWKVHWMDHRLRIYYSPSHNSVITWAHSRPAPLGRANIVTLDTLGHSRLMTLERWAWLIAMTDASDAQLLEWARSFAKPPSVEITGGRVDFDSDVP